MNHNDEIITPEEGYYLAKYQRPGRKIVMGPHAARDDKIAPLTRQHMSALPGFWSFYDYDTNARLSFVPSFWSKCFAFAAITQGRVVTDDEWRWLHGKASLSDARAWLFATQEEQTDDT